jgi:hypothetical protein
MKRISILALAIGLFTLQSIQAERIMGTPGVISEFTQVEELVKNKKITKDYRKKTLEKNLVNAVRFTILKKYPDYQEKVKDLNASSIAFEQQKGTFNYFLKFKEYFLYYNFAVDPELYVQLPADERFYIKNPELFESESASTNPKPEASTP